MTATTTEPTTAATAEQTAAAPAPAPAAPKVDTNSWGWGVARKNQKTGARIIIDRTAREGQGADRVYEDVPVTVDPAKGKYLMFCIDHRTLAYTDSQNTAGENRRAPYAWCPECKSLLDSGKRVGAKEPEVKEPKPEKAKAEKKAKQSKIKPEDVPVVTTVAEQQAELAAQGEELAPRAERFEQPGTPETEALVPADGEPGPTLVTIGSDYTREPIDESGSPVAEQAAAPKAKRRLGKK